MKTLPPEFNHTVDFISEVIAANCDVFTAALANIADPDSRRLAGMALMMCNTLASRANDHKLQDALAGMAKLIGGEETARLAKIAELREETESAPATAPQSQPAWVSALLPDLLKIRDQLNAVLPKSATSAT